MEERRQRTDDNPIAKAYEVISLAGNTWSSQKANRSLALWMS